MRDWREEIRRDARRERILEILLLFVFMAACIAVWESGWRLGMFDSMLLFLVACGGLHKALRWWGMR